MNLDWLILDWIQDTLKCGWMDWLMPKITVLGNGGIIWIVISVFMLCTKRYRKNGIILLASLLVGVLVGNVCLKHLIARSRPCWLNPEVTLLIANPTDFSFPQDTRFPARLRRRFFGKRIKGLVFRQQFSQH